MIIYGITGHRDGNPTDMEESAVMIINYVRNNGGIISVGGAGGFDTYVIIAAYLNNVKIILRLPYKDFGNPYLHSSLRRKGLILNESFEEINYKSNNLYLKRNDKIINDCKSSNKLFAYYDGRKGGGTYYTMIKAKNNGREVINTFEVRKLE